MTAENLYYNEQGTIMPAKQTETEIISTPKSSGAST